LLSSIVTLKTTTSITWLSSEILKNKTDIGKEQSYGFESPDVSDLSFKMDMDVKKETFNEANNSNWKEFFLVCFILFFIIMNDLDYHFFLTRIKKFAKKWSYRLNKYCCLF
jgi:hypothetical protein